jgi:hypothetical protein
MGIDERNRPMRPVGWKSANDPADVEYVHRMLLTVPERQGGPPASFMATQPYSSKTDTAIYNFQKKQGLIADAVVSPGGVTITKIREMMKGHQQRHEYEPSTVTILVTDRIVGHGYVKGYDGKPFDDGSKLHPMLGRFRVPIFEMRVGVGDPKVEFAFKSYHVMRFGVRLNNNIARNGGKFKEIFKVEGPPEGEFFPTRIPYKFGKFAWQIKNEFLMHVGPENPHFRGDDTLDGMNKMVAGIGCVMLVGPGNFTKMNDWIRTCAFSDLYRERMISAEDADARIGKYKALRMVIASTAPPPLLPLTDFRSSGGPPPIKG